MRRCAQVSSWPSRPLNNSDRSTQFIPGRALLVSAALVEHLLDHTRKARALRDRSAPAGNTAMRRHITKQVVIDLPGSGPEAANTIAGARTSNERTTTNSDDFRRQRHERETA